MTGTGSKVVTKEEGEKMVYIFGEMGNVSQNEKCHPQLLTIRPPGRFSWIDILLEFTGDNVFNHGNPLTTLNKTLLVHLTGEQICY